MLDKNRLGSQRPLLWLEFAAAFDGGGMMLAFYYVVDGHKFIQSLVSYFLFSSCSVATSVTDP